MKTDRTAQVRRISFAGGRTVQSSLGAYVIKCMFSRHFRMYDSHDIILFLKEGI